MLKLLLMGPAPQHQCHQITMSHIKIFQIFSIFSCSLVSTIDAQVPASTAESLRQGAFEELGHSKPQPEVQGAAPSWKRMHKEMLGIILRGWGLGGKSQCPSSSLTLVKGNRWLFPTSRQKPIWNF
jgi:hypothetical protein